MDPDASTSKGMTKNGKFKLLFTRTNKQIHALAPVLNSPSKPELATVVSSNRDVPVAVVCKEKDGVQYFFCVVMRSGETEATFTVPKAPAGAKVEVLGENRSLSFTGKRFKDAFKAWDVHLYRIAR